jgi:hypothetical protein
MNLTLKLKIENAMKKIHGMFGEMPWFVGTEMIENKETISFLIYVESKHINANDVVKFLNQIKIDRFPIQAQLK